MASALQFGLRRSAAAILTSSSRLGGLQTAKGSIGFSASDTLRRWKSSDAGDVIGIDLGTTNSCVAIMVSNYLCQ